MEEVESITKQNFSIQRKRTATNLKKIPCPTCARPIANEPSSMKRHKNEYHDRIKNHFCGFCDAGFYQHQSLQRHVLIHTKEKHGKCRICSFEISCFYTTRKTHFNAKLYSASLTYEEFKTMISEDDDDNALVFSCNSCDTKFHIFSELLDHIHPNVKCLVCTECGSGYDTLEQKQDHVRLGVEEADGNLTCNVCHETFDTTCARNKHKWTHRPFNSAVSNGKCNHCSLKPSSHLALQLHIKAFHSSASATDSNPYHTCDECKIIFRNHNLLQCHRALVHSKVSKIFNCHIESCPEEFKTMKKYMKHIFLEHCRGKQNNCIYCDDNYYWTMRSHVEKHIVEASKAGIDCICKFCNERFNSSLHLKVHVPVCKKNENVKSLQCYFCGSSGFKTASDLRVHLIRHVKERSHKCNICGKQWVTSGDLTKQMKSHQGAKNYICTHCGKAFAIVENKIRHENTVHSAQKVSCQICGKQFAHHNYLKDHLNIHNEEKAFKCKVCGKAYTSRPNMYRHIREVHK